MIQMPTDGDNKDNSFDEISSLLKKYYKPETEVDIDKFWEDVENKIDSLFHKEIFSSKSSNDEGNILSDEERYWLGLEEYIDNKASAIKHKTITDHLLVCKECRQNYSDYIDKKKVPSEFFAINNIWNQNKNSVLLNLY